jgi:hypothetical protein
VGGPLRRGRAPAQDAHHADGEVRRCRGCCRRAAGRRSSSSSSSRPRSRPAVRWPATPSSRRFGRSWRQRPAITCRD